MTDPEHDILVEVRSAKYNLEEALASHSDDPARYRQQVEL